jgi:DNA-binding transcriptional MocR family regulator
MEVPADPRNGVDLDELENTFRRNRIKACLLIPNFHNPLGALMPDDHKIRLVQLINEYEIFVIEDDISSELHFGRKRPMPLKFFDKKDRVITCSSFSKTLAPGLRIGWVIPGQRLKEKVQNLKAATTISTSTLDQYLISQYLAEGAFERHLRRLRNTLKKQVFRTALAIHKHFPSGTRLALPDGGTLLWVELPAQIAGLKVYRGALDHQIAIIPGVVCSNSRQFKNFIQISCGSPFTEDIERGIMRLGEIVSELAA